jgi:hypothetical protein
MAFKRSRHCQIQVETPLAVARNVSGLSAMVYTPNGRVQTAKLRSWNEDVVIASDGNSVLGSTGSVVQ